MNETLIIQHANTDYAAIQITTDLLSNWHLRTSCHFAYSTAHCTGDRPGLHAVFSTSQYDGLAETHAHKKSPPKQRLDGLKNSNDQSIRR